MQPIGRTEFFWPRQLVRKWLQFKPTGDDFRADYHHFDSDSPAVEDEDDEKENSAGGSFDFLPELLRPGQEDLRVPDRPLIRGQSETLRKQYLDKKEYRIAVGTWNVAGRPPPVELDLDEWLDSNAEADIYVLGFQEIVPLNAGNVLCIEDEGPAAKWENLIREALNSRATSSFHAKSHSAPQSPWNDHSEIDIDRIIDGVASEDKICSIVESQFSQSKSTDPGQPQDGDFERKAKRSNKVTPVSPEERSYSRTASDGRVILHARRWSTSSDARPPRVQSSQSISDDSSLVDPVVGKDVGLYDWSGKGSSPGPAQGFHSFLEQEESLQTPLFPPTAENETFSRDSSQSRSRFSRIASKQMVGLFLTVWVRSDLRQDVHNVKVSCVGCGLMGYLGNKGSISVSMCLHQTSFCFTCSHLTSGHKDGDEYRRNSDVAEILRRTSFPRSSKLLQLPETIMSHDCMIWLGDLNYRLAATDQEARSMIANEDWDALLEKDQLKIEQNAGNVFDGWEEGQIYFAPTYKYAPNSERYSGDSPKAGEKRRTPAWCDRILWMGRALRETRYVRSESRLSDHRPVSALFVAEVERLSRHKLKKAVSFASPMTNVNTEDISPHLSSLRSFHRLPLNEMNYPSMSEQRSRVVPVSTARLTVSQSLKYKLRKERSLTAGCMKVGDDFEKIPSQGSLRSHVLSVF